MEGNKRTFSPVIEVNNINMLINKIEIINKEFCNNINNLLNKKVNIFRDKTIINNLDLKINYVKIKD